jgi:hypothetical protein
LRLFTAIELGCALVCLFCFLVPLWVMSPFRLQGERELPFALTLLRFGPTITALLAVIAVAAAFQAWSNWVIVAVVAAILMRINLCELVFRPYPHLTFNLPEAVTLASDNMVMSVSIGGETHAYSVGAIGYHHVVNDMVGGVPIAPSYCSLCHSGIVWDRRVNGRALTFHLIGIRNGNALLVDAETGSVWQQTSGEAIFGPLKGTQLEMVYSDELTFSLWRAQYPEGLMLKPRPTVRKLYSDAGWEDFVTRFPPLIDTADSGIEPREVMLGISAGPASKAFPLKTVLAERVIEDHVGGQRVLLIVGPDGISVRAFQVPADSASGTWDFSGYATSGPLAGEQLQPLEAVKHFWYDWRAYHPDTEVYGK